jgi:cobalamin biosynthesis protein CobT
VSGKSKKSKSYKSYGASSWWMDDWDYSPTVYSSYSKKEIESKNLYKMAAHRRAIANFVNIVTGQSIPVKFSTKGDSYTDGKTVTISAKIVEPNEFDPAVGLALHEGSHIKLSDFNLLRELEVAIHRKIGVDKFKEFGEIAADKKMHSWIYVVKDILNYVEDRRIDNYIYKSAPGYRDYYRAMYDKYFNDPSIDKGMQSDEFTEETFESYMFRLINLHSKFSKPNALKELPTIARIIKLNEISRLRNTDEALTIALEVFEVILRAIEPIQTANQNSNGQAGQGGSGSQAGEGEKEAGEDDIDVQMGGDDENGSDGMGDVETDLSDEGEGDDSGSGIAADGKGLKGKLKVTVGDSKGKPGKGKLSQRQLDIIRKKIEKQKEFLRGQIKKTKVTQSEQNQLSNIEQSGAELKVVGQTYTTRYGGTTKGIECVVVKKMTRSLMEQSNFPLTSQRYSSKPEEDTLYSQHENEVLEGIRIGTLLGKKLQVRGESRDTVFNRQLVGKLDRRMVSALGYGNEHVFFTKETDQFKKANLHISVDASGSMGGSKWKKTMVNIVALAKAVDMIPNLSIQISFRTTTNELPYVVIAYDSRTDKFIKVKQLFKYLTPGGTTPEGLCFEAIMKNMVGSTTDMDSYFLNISDGEPYFHGKDMSYSGDSAASHTYKMVKMIESMGIKVLSYFVSDYSDGGEETSSGYTFKKSYGKAASFINVTNVNEVTRTMNKLFMNKA